MKQDNGNHAATPGPWVFKKQTFHNASFGGENTGEAVTHAGSVKIGELEIIDPRLSEADARLIAAAPELLEALESLVPAVAVSEINAGQKGFKAEWVAARAIVAKAKGD